MRVADVVDRGELMRIGVYQFSGSGDMETNAAVMCCALRSASARGVRLLVFQECALCGYPPIETESVTDINFKRAGELLQTIAATVQSCGMYAAIGVVRREGDAFYNALQLIGPSGKTIGYYDKKALWG